MKSRAEKLIGMGAIGTDGEIGTVQDLYFDDERWAIRYLIIESGEWLSHRRVLISPLSVLDIGEREKPISVNLNRKIIAASPDVSTKKPVSRRFEVEYSKYFAYPIYWAGGGLWGGAMNPVAFTKGTLTEEEEREALERDSDESHLRSVREVIGYHIRATNGSVGHIDDFLIDNDTWGIEGIIIDTRNWFPGKKVIVEPRMISEILWSESIVAIGMEKDEVRECPELA